jgi:hypothetical protein
LRRRWAWFAALALIIIIGRNGDLSSDARDNCRKGWLSRLFGHVTMPISISRYVKGLTDDGPKTPNGAKI